jgi:hypothetical protein
MIRRQVTAPSSSPASAELVGSSGAFLEGSLAITLEHQAGGAPDVDLGYHTPKCTGAVDKGLRLAEAAEAAS